jgi:hypothetical protein
MTTSLHGQSQYDRRLALVVSVIVDRTKLTGDDAVPLATSILDAVDRIPERVR